LAIAFALILGSAADAQPTPQRRLDTVRFDSWQIRHPVSTAFVSTLTLSYWPRRFADDLQTVTDSYQPGWTTATEQLLEPHALIAYRNAKTIISIFEVLLISAAIVAAIRKRK